MFNALHHFQVGGTTLCENVKAVHWYDIRYRACEIAESFMTMTTRICCTRRLEFDAAHRVLRHESKCRHLHGHRYAVEASFEAAALDALGRVVDFGVVKERLGAWIDEHWDHATILAEQDRALGEAIEAQTGQRVYYLEGNPTAEHMARYLLESVCPSLFEASGVTCTRIRLYETPNCYADAARAAM